jgi:hypothetical protein
VWAAWLWVSLRDGQRDCGRFGAKVEAHLRRVSCNGSAGLLGREVRLESLGASADTAKLSGRNVKVAVKLPASR